MTNVLAPYSESKLIYNGYANMNMLNNSMTFIIPVYNNMPETPVENPNIIESDFTNDNTKVYADVQTTLNIREGPSSSYEILTSVDRKVEMTRLAKGKQSGELWDKVQLSNGITGYVFQSYLKEVPEKQIEQINLSIDDTKIEKGKTQQLKVEILPEAAKDHIVEYSSSNPKVASVDSQGTILGIRSGKATITVKAKENNIASSIEIQVYTPVTDMQLDIENLVIQEGDTFLIKPIIFPADADNKNIIYTSEKEEIAKISSAGLITAIQEGSCKIKVTTEENAITKEINVTVVPKLQEDEISFDESLKVNKSEITGWNIQQLTVEEIKKKINTIYTIEIYNAKGTKLENGELAGTGSKIRLIDEAGSIKMEYQMIIYGDVNGDGKINSVDLLVLQRHILEIEKLKGVFLKAGNINKDGKNPSSLDSLLIQRHILELKMIEQ